MGRHDLRNSEFPYAGPSYTAAYAAIGTTILLTNQSEQLIVEVANVSPFQEGMRFFIVGSAGGKKVTLQSEDAPNERVELHYRLV